MWACWHVDGSLPAAGHTEPVRLPVYPSVCPSAQLSSCLLHIAVGLESHFSHFVCFVLNSNQFLFFSQDLVSGAQWWAIMFSAHFNHQISYFIMTNDVLSTLQPSKTTVCMYVSVYDFNHQISFFIMVCVCVSVCECVLVSVCASVCECAWGCVETPVVFLSS